MGGMKPADESDDAVVLKAIAGDDAAFHELVLRRQAWLRSVMRRLANDAILADDLCQEALLKAWRRIGALEDHRAIDFWLRRIAVRTWMDWARAKRLDMRDVDPDTLEDLPAAGGVQTADHRLDLQTAIADLRPGPRACVVLFYGEGMSHSEIAAATGFTIGVVKSNIARATARLRNTLAEWGNE
jgi:RNA polymerase sigma-70 factor (ECF subfamily)